jgi:FMN-dependent NADH-azoreductase
MFKNIFLDASGKQKSQTQIKAEDIWESLLQPYNKVYVCDMLRKEIVCLNKEIFNDIRDIVKALEQDESHQRKRYIAFVEHSLDYDSQEG